MSFFGYLDAGTGSIIIQSIIGIAAGVGVFGRKVIGNASYKVKNLFSRSEDTQKAPKSSE